MITATHDCSNLSVFTQVTPAVTYAVVKWTELACGTCRKKCGPVPYLFLPYKECHQMLAHLPLSFSILLYYPTFSMTLLVYSKSCTLRSAFMCSAAHDNDFCL